jgi:hypothetical protein
MGGAWTVAIFAPTPVVGRGTEAPPPGRKRTASLRRGLSVLFLFYILLQVREDFEVRVALLDAV